MRNTDQNRKRRKIVRVALAFTAILPVILGALQILHYCFWIFEWNYDSTDVFYLTKFSVTALVFAFVISLYERFCVFHRLTFLATLYMSCSYYLIDIYPSIFPYNITNLVADYLGDKDGYDEVAFTRLYADCIAKGEPIIWEDLI